MVIFFIKLKYLIFQIRKLCSKCANCATAHIILHSSPELVKGEPLRSALAPSSGPCRTGNDREVGAASQHPLIRAWWTYNLKYQFQISGFCDFTSNPKCVLTVLKGSVGLYLPEAAKTNQPTALFSDWPFTFLISNHFGLHPWEDFVQTKEILVL